MVAISLGLGLGLTPGKGGGVLPLQVVGTRGQVDLLAASARTSANVKLVSRTREYIGAGGGVGSDLTLSFANKRFSGTGIANGSDYTLRADVEINGICVQLTFGGQLSTTVAAGAWDVRADPVQPSTFGLTSFSEDTIIWRKMEKEFAVGGIPTYVVLNSNSPLISGELTLAAATGTASKIGVAGPMSAGSGWTTVAGSFGPLATLGRPLAPMRAVAVLGASLEAGQADTAGDGVNGAGGYIRRALVNVGGKKLAAINMAAAGETAGTFLLNKTERQAMLPFCNVALDGYGGNDFTTNQGAQTTLDRFNQIDTETRTLLSGAKKIFRVRLMAKSDSTDSWATLENQTVRVNSGSVNFLTFRNFLDAGASASQASGIIDYIIDTTAGIEPEPSKWLYNGTAFYGTPDGTHHSSVAAGIAASNTATSLAENT